MNRAVWLIITLIASLPVTYSVVLSTFLRGSVRVEIGKIVP